MRFALIPIALFILSSQAFALESFSIIRRSDALQLICVKTQCELFSSHDDKTVAKKVLSLKETEVFFAAAKQAFDEKAPISPSSAAQIHVALEWKNKKWGQMGMNPALLALETDLKARLRK